MYVTGVRLPGNILMVQRKTPCTPCTPLTIARLCVLLEVELERAPSTPSHY